jgi:hypothetical protein
MRSFDPLDLDVAVFAKSEDATAWCKMVAEQGVEEENLFMFACRLDTGPEELAPTSQN